MIDNRPSHTWLRAVEADRTLALHLPGGRQLLLWRLAAHCGHSNAPAEYAIKERRRLIIII